MDQELMWTLLQQQVTRASMALGKKAESVGQVDVYVSRQTNSILEERQSRMYEHLSMYKTSGPAISVLRIYIKSGHTQGRYPPFARAKSYGQPGVVTHTFNPSTLRQRQEDCCGFESSLVHTELQGSQDQ